MSTISSGTTLTTALVQTGDTTGDLVIKTGSSNTTAMTISGTDQSVTLVGSLTANTNASTITTGTVPTARLATGTANSSTYLRGDQTWAAIASSQWTTSGSNIYYNTGNVGIGSSSPTLPIQIVAGNKSAFNISYDGSGALRTGLFMWTAGGSDGAISGGVEQTADNVFTARSTVASYIRFNNGETRFFNNSGLTSGNTYTPTERMRIDTSGNVGIGRSSSIGAGNGINLELENATAVRVMLNNTAGSGRRYALNSNTDGSFSLYDNTGDVERLKVTSAGLFQFNSGYGSVQTAYGCRVWVNFNGTGTPAIRNSGGASSITDNGTCSYTINFSITLPDTNYSVNVSQNIESSGSTSQMMGVMTSSNSSYVNKATTAVRIQGYNPVSSNFDPFEVEIAVFR